MAKKGFMKLKDNELKSLEGMVAAIELQEGCPHRCLGCGTDAKKPGGSMDYEDVMAISKSIEKVRKENGIELFLQELGGEFMFFYGSDPAYYHSYSNGIEKTIRDVGKEFFSRHGKHMYFTTAGWKPGDTYMERAMAQTAADMGNDRSAVIDIGYSIKPFGALIRKEYERFCNRLIGSVFGMSGRKITEEYGFVKGCQIIKLKRGFPSGRKDYVNHLNMADWRWFIKKHLDDFFRESRYVHQVVENMKTLRGADVRYAYHCLDSAIHHYPQHLPKQNRKYEFLFSDEFMKLLADYCSQKAGGEISVSWGRCWSGIGRAKTELGLKPVALEQVRIADIEHCKDWNGDLFANVLFDGTINIMYGGFDDMRSVYVPERYFSRMAESFRDKDSAKSAHYRTLANLQGRNILR